MSKLPEFIFDSLKRYKADTNQLTAWLVETAKGLGYGLEPWLSTKGKLPRAAPKRRLNGKARKQAPGATSLETAAANTSVAEYRRVFVHEFTKLALFIAGSHPRIKVPSVVLKLARSAIAVRKRCAEWFKHQTIQDEDSSDRTHWHFITVLEEVVQILDPLCDRDDTTSATVEITSPVEAAAALVNPFSLLDIEETKDEELAETLPPVGSSTFPPRQMVVYTVAEDDSDDWLAIFCLFEDLREIRTFLRETWSDYRDRKIDLITASMTTNMAFDVIRSTQEDLLAFDPKLDNYEKITHALFSAAFRLLGVDFSAMELLDIMRYLNMNNVEEFVYFSTYFILQKFCDIIQPDAFPVFEPGQFGTYAPRQSRDLLSADEKRLEDRMILAEVLVDFILLARLDGLQPMPDELTKELRKMVCDKEISLLLVFAIQVYLDIHHVLREQVGRGLEDLRSAGVQMHISLRKRSQNSPRVECANWPKSNEDNVKRLNFFIQEWILKDYLGALKRVGISDRLPTEGYYLLTRHPLLCGMLQFRLQLDFQDFGLTLATAWGSIHYVSHLYEAGKHEGFLELDSWEDMEWIMKVHDKERMFRGRVPQNANESFKSLRLVAGQSASSLASTSRAEKQHSSRQSRKLSPKGPSFLEKKSPVSDMFRIRIVRGGVALTAETMEALLADIGVDQPQLSEPQTKQLHQPWAQSRTMTPLQFLVTLRAAMVAEQLMIRFDYVSLHMRCLKLLLEIKVTLHDKLVLYHGEGYIKDESHLAWLVDYILSSAKESDTAAELMQRRNGSKSSNVMLMPASQVVDAFIKREGHAECTKLDKALKQRL